MRSVRPRYAIRTAGLVAALFATVGALVLGRDGAYVLAVYLATETGLTLLRGNPVLAVGSVRMDTAFLAFWTTLILLISLTSSSKTDGKSPGAQADTLNTLD
jgi:hypothetical protein